MKFRLALAALAMVTLSGCASNCTDACIMGFGPGNAVFNSIADNADKGDPCQTAQFSRETGARLRPAGYKAPDYCDYRSNNRTRITDRNGRTLGYIR